MLENENVFHRGIWIFVYRTISQSNHGWNGRNVGFIMSYNPFESTVIPRCRDDIDGMDNPSRYHNMALGRPILKDAILVVRHKANTMIWVNCAREPMPNVFIILAMEEQML